MDLGAAGRGWEFVHHDGDSCSTSAFGEVFRAAGAGVVGSAVRAPPDESGHATAAVSYSTGPWPGTSGT